MFRVFKNSIFGKIFGSLILVLLLTEAAIIFVSLKQQEARITENLINRSLILAKITSRQIEIAYQNKTLPFEIFEAISGESEDVVFLWLTKPDGGVYFANDPELTLTTEVIMGKRIKEPFLGTEKTLIQDWTYPQGVEKIKLIVQPVGIRDEKGRPWNLLMGVSLRSVVAAEKAIIFNSLGFFILTFFLTIFISFYLTKRITNPLEKLKEGTAIIGKGDLDYRIEIKTGDELEKLAGAFNKMAKDLGESRGKVKTAYEIEKKARLELVVLDKAKNQFLLTTQHHLRTPLTIIKGYLEQLSQNKLGILTPSVQNVLQKIDGTINRLIKLINDFLDVSQLEIGKSIFNLQLIQLKPIIDDIIADLQPEIVKKNLVVSLADDLASWPFFLLDLSKFREALYILIDNAVKYNVANGSIIFKGQIEKYSRDTNKKIFQLIIQNTGIGISREELSRIFTQYFARGEEAKKIYAAGSGIGLVLAKSIIEAHHGRIWAESEGRDKGAKFIIELEMDSKIG